MVVKVIVWVITDFRKMNQVSTSFSEKENFWCIKNWGKYSKTRVIFLSNWTTGEVSHLQEKQTGFLLVSSLVENILVTREISQLYAGSSISPRYIPVQNNEGGFLGDLLDCVLLYIDCVSF